MNVDRATRNSLHDAVASSRAGDLSESGVALLESLLQASRENRAYFMRLMALQSDLDLGLPMCDVARDELPLSDHGLPHSAQAAAQTTERGGSPAEIQPAHRPADEREARALAMLFDWRRNPLRFGSLVLCLTFLAWIGFFALFVPRSNQPPRPDVADNNAAMNDVSPADARLTRVRGARWANGRRFGAGSGIPRGTKLRLEAGLAEVQFGQGATIILQGPCEWTVRDANGMELRQGVSAVRVPPSAAGFVVQTPHAKIVDLGTEFDVLVRDGDTLTKVISGEIEIIAVDGAIAQETPVEDDPQAAPREGSVKRRLQAGETARIEAGGVTASAADEADVIPNLRRSFEPLALASRYRETIVAARPLAYWRFESANGDSIPNEMGEADPLQKHGQARAAHRADDAEGASAYFSRGSAGAFRGFTLSRPLNELVDVEYSIELWACPDAHPNKGKSFTLFALCGGEQSAGARPGHYALIEMIDEAHPLQLAGGARFAHRSRASILGDLGIGVRHGFRPRQWSHVAAVKTREKIVLYINGELKAAEPVPGLMEEAPQHLVVGALFPWAALHERAYIGRIDELAIYNRALSAKEVQEHYRAATEADAAER